MCSNVLFLKKANFVLSYDSRVRILGWYAGRQLDLRYAFILVK